MTKSKRTLSTAAAVLALAAGACGKDIDLGGAGGTGGQAPASTSIGTGGSGGTGGLTDGECLEICAPSEERVPQDAEVMATGLKGASTVVVFNQTVKPKCNDTVSCNDDFVDVSVQTVNADAIVDSQTVCLCNNEPCTNATPVDLLPVGDTKAVMIVVLENVNGPANSVQASLDAAQQETGATDQQVDDAITASTFPDPNKEKRRTCINFETDKAQVLN